MDSVNREVIQVRHSILGFVVILQISQEMSSIGTRSAFCSNLSELPQLAVLLLICSLSLILFSLVQNQAPGSLG